MLALPLTPRNLVWTDWMIRELREHHDKRMKKVAPAERFLLATVRLIRKRCSGRFVVEMSAKEA